MKKWLNYIVLPFCILLFFTTIGGLASFIHSETNRSKTTLNANLSPILEQAIKDFTKNKSGNILMAGDFNNRPESFGKYETHTYQDMDTSFIYQHKIVDINTSIYQGVQRYLLSTGELQSKNIKTQLDSILIRKEIKAQTAIGIRSSGYPKKMLSWSNDTLAMSKNGYAEYIMEGDFTQIHYTAYIEYTPTTIRAHMNKTPIYLWAIAVIITGGLLIYQISIKKRKKKNDFVPNEKESKLLIDSECIILEERKKVMAPQSQRILQMLLNADKYRIEKKRLKEIWSAKGDPTNSMSSAIGRINKSLKEIACNLKIITDPNDADFYVLRLAEQTTKASKSPKDEVHV